ncbi:MAG: sensor histidine kinase, partial [Faecousia sp.]
MKTYPIQSRLRRLVAAVSVLMAVLLVSVLVMLISCNSHYSRLLHNVTTASEFNREFKNTID